MFEFKCFYIFLQFSSFFCFCYSIPSIRLFYYCLFPLSVLGSFQRYLRSARSLNDHTFLLEDPSLKMTFSPIFLQVPADQGYLNARRGSDPGPSTTSNNFGPSQSLFPGGNGPSTLFHNYVSSPYLDRLCLELENFQVRMQRHQLQYSPYQLLQLRDLLQNSLNSVQNSIPLCTGLLNMNPYPNLPPSSTHTPSTRPSRHKSECFRCRLCREGKESICGTRGAFRRHVEDQHCPRSQYHCAVPDCQFRCHRRYKARDHLRGHIESGALPAGMTRELQSRPVHRHFSRCWLCPRTVRSWNEWFECIANHCRIPPSSTTHSIQDMDKRNNDDNNDNGGSSSGSNGNSFDEVLRQYITSGTGSQFGSDVSPGCGPSDQGGYFCVGGNSNPNHSPTDRPVKTQQAACDALDYEPAIDVIEETAMPSSQINQTNQIPLGPRDELLQSPYGLLSSGQSEDSYDKILDLGSTTSKQKHDFLPDSNGNGSKRHCKYCGNIIDGFVRCLSQGTVDCCNWCTSTSSEQLVPYASMDTLGSCDQFQPLALTPNDSSNKAPSRTRSPQGLPTFFNSSSPTKHKRRLTLQEGTRVIRKLLSLWSAVARPRKVAERIEDMDLAVVDPRLMSLRKTPLI